ncbi:hypothetical protein CASFOL_010727 [Castilleja foliolosa]|uniref:RING-type E3 ubiquitin transferase n=1 Tax=Castilleja foliolosa TaxID=1961234 RepID=A0ABD3DVC7_9LAMI
MAIGSTQPLSPSPDSSAAHTFPQIIIILTFIIFIFSFFVPTAIGLDPLIVQSFPTFNYSTVKEYRKEKYGLECAICLIEFRGSNVLRLLTTCYHVFHQECVDLWLESHNTCPVCRRNLESPARSPAKSLGLVDNNETMDSISITIKDDGEESKAEKFTRSHSTGHSLIRNKEIEIEEEDRYKLVLPEHVKSDIIRAHHNPSQSCPSFSEIKADQNDIANINGPAENRV